MLLSEVAGTKAHFVGSCVNSFDEDGDCIIHQLPWNDTTEFAQALEDQQQISKEQFVNSVETSSITNEVVTKAEEFSLADNVFIAYDSDEDVHYFFVK